MKACVFNRKMNRILLIIILSVLFVPLIAMLYFYLAIFKAIKYAVEMDAVGAHEINEEINPEKNSENKINLDDLKQAFKFSKGLFIMYIMYSLTIIPLCLMLIIDIDQEWPDYLHQFPWLFYRLCSAATPVVYPLFHPSIRSGYKNAIDRYVLRKKKLLNQPRLKPIHIRKKRMQTKL
jgi:hypothetical protein